MSGVVVVESLYYRDQFDDWIGGGRVRVGSTTCLWRAHNNLSGFGRDRGPVVEKRDWRDLTETQAEAAIAAIEHALQAHRREYAA